MKSKEILLGICKEIYTQMFKESKPSTNFLNMVKRGETKVHDWFMKYYLSIDRQQEIIKDVCKKHKLSKYNTHRVSVEVHTGCSPNSCKETWELSNKDVSIEMPSPN